MHSLADLRAFLTALAPQRLRSWNALRILEICSPGGLPTADDRILRRAARNKIMSLTQLNPNTHVIHPLPELYTQFAIPSAKHAASMHRVLHTLLKSKSLPAAFVGLLIHASRDGGIRSNDLPTLHWCKDIATRVTPFLTTLPQGFLHIEEQPIERGNHPPKHYTLTPAGKTLLLGQWGKASRPTRYLNANAA